MAKRGRKPGSRLEKTAVNIGRILGHVAARVDALRKQRHQLNAELDHIVKVAHQLRSDLGPAAKELGRAGNIALAAGKKARRKMSPEARAKIAAAARKRWAAYRKAKKA